MSLINSERNGLSPANPSESTNTKPAVIESDTKTGQQADPVEVPEVFLANGEFNDEAIHWLPGHIVDQLYLQMCDSKTIPVTKHLLTGETYCEIQNKYYTEAATYAGRISAGDFSGKNAKYEPVFRLYLEDFSPRLKAELAQLPKETVHKIVTIEKAYQLNEHRDSNLRGEVDGNLINYNQKEGHTDLPKPSQPSQPSQPRLDISKKVDASVIFDDSSSSLKLIHSPAAQVLTNDDLDTEDEGIRGESI